MGDAYRSIETLEVMYKNYLIAWEIINKKYKSNKEIIHIFIIIFKL